MTKFIPDNKVENDILDYIVKCKYDFSPLKNIWKHKGLYKEFIPKEFLNLELNSVRFTPDEKGIVWDFPFTYRPLENIDGDLFIRFEGDFSVNGNLSFYVNNNYPTVEVQVIYDLTLKVDYLNEVRIETIEYWTGEQKIINLYNYMMNDLYKKLGFKSLKDNPSTDFGKFTEIWGKVSRSNQKQVHTSSFYYHHEIMTSYEPLMFLVSNVNLYRKYTSDYLRDIRHESIGTMYDITLNLYDWNYLKFCTLSLENLYSY
ncbi:MAG: hypothetical protein Q8867_04935 [Bacteroidota bacterium]|nr:hypothetical protein [Bacteroidota bacterium]